MSNAQAVQTSLVFRNARVMHSGDILATCGLPLRGANKRRH
jgi:hypothetical protein